MTKQNCWDYKGCGREPGGVRAVELGVCPAATETRVAGFNGGINGGRACWAVAGTFCRGRVRGTFAMKFASCTECGFYKMVMREEGRNYCHANRILDQLRRPRG